MGIESDTVSRFDLKEQLINLETQLGRFARKEQKWRTLTLFALALFGLGTPILVAALSMMATISSSAVASVENSSKRYDEAFDQLFSQIGPILGTGFCIVVTAGIFTLVAGARHCTWKDRLKRAEAKHARELVELGNMLSHDDEH